MHWLALTLAVLTSAPVGAEDAALDPAEPFRIGEAGRISVSVGHGYALEEALARLGHLLGYWKERFKIASEWHGNRVWLTGSLFGFKVRAVFSVSEAEVVAVASDPGWPWRRKAEGYVEEKLKKYLHPTYDEP